MSADCNTFSIAPNFRKVPSLDVYGVGQSTTDGILNILHHVNRPSETHLFLWTNLREGYLLPSFCHNEMQLSLGLSHRAYRIHSRATICGTYLVQPKRHAETFSCYLRRCDNGMIHTPTWVLGTILLNYSTDKGFPNTEITGIEPDQVEAMEQRLKTDILKDSVKHGNRYSCNPTPRPLSVLFTFFLLPLYPLLSQDSPSR